MKISPYSYNSHVINDASYKARLLSDAPMATEADVVEIQRADASPVYGGKTLRGQYFPLHITILAADENAAFETLLGWFDTRDNTPRKLVVYDTANSNKAWYRMVTPVSVPAKFGKTVTVNLYAADPVWYENVESSDTWAITASGQTKALTVGGNVNTRPRLAVTASTGTAGYAYSLYKQVINPSTSVTFGWPYPLFLATAWDTTGKVQADGDDIRVMIDGVEVPRWVSGAGTASTKVSCNISLQPKVTFSLRTAIAASGAITEIYLTSTAASRESIRKLTAGRAVVIGSERFAYTGIDTVAMKLTGVTRAAKQSSMAAHSAGDTITYIEHDIWILYGNATATAPEQDETYQPIINLTTSTNTSWVYTLFRDADGLRAGAWDYSLSAASVGQVGTSDTCVYTTSHGGDVDPADSMGMKLAAYTQYGRWFANSGSLVWQLYHPAGITDVATTGGKYTTTAASWPARASLQYSASGITWVTKWTATIPTITTWTAVSETGALNGTTAYRYIRYILAGSVTGAENGYAALEVTDTTLTLAAGGVPVITDGTEAALSQFTGSFANSATGQTITLDCPLKTGDTVTVDCENYTVTTSDGASLVGGLSMDANRAAWLELAPGANTLTYTGSAGLTSVSVTVYWRDRQAQ